MSSIGNSEDLIPVIFSFLSPSSYVACSLVSSLWETTSRPYIYQHITALRGITFAQCVALFTGDRKLAQYVRSCCFHYSIPASAYIHDNISVFIQYILSTCNNLIALTFWDVPLDGDGLALLPKGSRLRVLTFQNCTWQYSALKALLECCTNTQLLQFCNTPLFSDDRVYHRWNFALWKSRWNPNDVGLATLTPTSILIQSPQRQLCNAFWQILLETVNVSTLMYLKLLPHLNDGIDAGRFIAASLHTIRRLETTVTRKLL